MSLIKKLAGQTVIYGLSHILSRVLLFVVFTWYLTRRFDGDTTEYGIYNDMYSYAALFLTILIFRLDTAFFRFGSKGDLQKTFSTGMIAVVGLSAVVLLVLLPSVDHFARILHYTDAPHYITWFAYILVLDAFTALVFAKFRLESKPMRFMYFKLLNVGLTIGLVLLFLEVLPNYYGETFERLKTTLNTSRDIDFVFLANLLASLIVVLAMIPELLRVKWSFDAALFKKMAIYASPLVLVGIAGNVNQSFAVPLQKIFLSDNIMDNLANAGVYGAAAKLAILLNLFTTAFNYAAEPFFFNNSDKKDAIKIYGKVALAFTLVACLVTVGLVFYIDIIVLIIGEKYRVGAHIVPILLFAYVFLGLYYNVSIWYKLKDKTHIGALISFIGMFVTIAISILLLPRIGYVASAWAALACYVVMVVIGYIVGQKYYPVNYPVKKIVFYVFTSALLCFLSIQSRSLDLSPILYYSIVSLVLLGILWFVYQREGKGLLKA